MTILLVIEGQRPLTAARASFTNQRLSVDYCGSQFHK